MYTIEPEKTIRLQFRGMIKPVAVSVPTYTLRYLDLHAARTYEADGTITYRQTERDEVLPELCPPRFPPTLLAA